MPSPLPRQLALPHPDLDRAEDLLLQQRVDLDDCGHALQDAADKVRQARRAVSTRNDRGGPA